MEDRERHIHRSYYTRILDRTDTLRLDTKHIATMQTVMPSPKLVPFNNNVDFLTYWTASDPLSFSSLTTNTGVSCIVGGNVGTTDDRAKGGVGDVVGVLSSPRPLYTSTGSNPFAISGLDTSVCPSYLFLNSSITMAGIM